MDWKEIDKEAIIVNRGFSNVSIPFRLVTKVIIDKDRRFNEVIRLGIETSNEEIRYFAPWILVLFRPASEREEFLYHISGPYVTDEDTGNDVSDEKDINFEDI